MPRRGRPARSGQRSTERIEFCLTPAEMAAVNEFMRKYRYASVADMVRLLVLAEVAEDAELFPQQLSESQKIG